MCLHTHIHSHLLVCVYARFSIVVYAQAVGVCLRARAHTRSIMWGSRQHMRFFCFAVFAYLFTYHPRSPCAHTSPPLPTGRNILFFNVSPSFCIPLHIQKQMGHDCRTHFQHFRSNYRVRSMYVGVCVCVGVRL